MSTPPSAFSGRMAAFVLVAVVAITALPLLMFRNDPSAEFAGADGQAGDEISRIDPDHEPWFAPIWSPPGGETESMLFALQAALGAGVLGYVAGSLRTRHRLATANAGADTSQGAAIDLRETQETATSTPC